MIIFTCLVYACPREHDYFGTTVARGTAQSAGAVRVSARKSLLVVVEF